MSSRACVVDTAGPSNNAGHDFDHQHLPKIRFRRRLNLHGNSTVWLKIAVRAGLGLAPGQELLITATLDAIPLARLITEQAYKAGASLVTTLFSDEQSALLRFRTVQSQLRHRSFMAL